nr:immunoglobulin heavy chain junction region [Macaca mulatta]MOW75914.1 immunoglobulin heavy chain junction region [Macaca mulatta]MOW79641.1 immunoglobulin heavy chain junction region [Macaca mulatta]MOW80248.1 immunoglobulin heavy chain junction region [Macaca mulatta]MOW82238.1 immunoglobulin heavy chain junction region [Macaca mulatta]
CARHVEGGNAFDFW